MHERVYATILTRFAIYSRFIPFLALYERTADLFDDTHIIHLICELFVNLTNFTNNSLLVRVLFKAEK